MSGVFSRASRGRQARPLELPLPPRGRARSASAISVVLPYRLPSRVGHTHAPMLSCPVGYPHAWATLSPTRRCLLALWATLTRGLHPRADAFLPCGLPSRVGYALTHAPPSRVGYALTHAPLPSCPVGYPHTWTTPTRRCFLALWATLTRGLRSNTRATAFLPCGLSSCVGYTRAPMLSCPVVYRHARATLSPARRCLLALWATLMRGPRSVSKPP